MAHDLFDLERFVEAQARVWDSVLAELRAGEKQTHWMWFIFPQLEVLGRSSMARHYGLSGVEEARAYLAHPVLGARLREAIDILMKLEGRSAVEIFTKIDAMKLRSSLTLFAAASGDPIFRNCLQRYFDAGPDPLTVAQVGVVG